MSHPQTRAAIIARVSGMVVGFGCLISAGIHQGFGGPEVHETLAAAQGQVPPLFLAQIEAVWIGITLLFVLLGVGFLMAATRRAGWLYTLGRAAALWFAGLACAFAWVAPSWGAEAFGAQFFLLAVLAAVSALASVFAAPRHNQPRA